MNKPKPFEGLLNSLDRTTQLEVEIEALSGLLKRDKNSEILSIIESSVIKNLLEEIKTELRREQD